MCMCMYCTYVCVRACVGGETQRERGGHAMCERGIDNNNARLTG